MKLNDPIRISDESGSAPDGLLLDGLKQILQKQKQDGYRSVFFTLEAGDITANQLRCIGNLLETFLQKEWQEMDLLKILH